jgi:hypothetical protein
LDYFVATFARTSSNQLRTMRSWSSRSVWLNPAGVEFLVTPTGSATGNTIVHNTIEQNACGIKGPAAGNNVNNNVLTANGADSCNSAVSATTES